MPSGDFGYSDELPEDLRDVFMWLCLDVASLHNKWALYLGLFDSEAKTALMSELALGSFQIIEESLRVDIAMAISRLSDPPQTMRRENLSLQLLHALCLGLDGAEQLLKDFLAACHPVRQFRNKLLAHNDLNTRLKPLDNPLPGVGRPNVDHILELASNLLNAVYQSHVGAELGFRPFMIGGAEDLIHWLQMAKEDLADKDGIWMQSLNLTPGSR